MKRQWAVMIIALGLLLPTSGQVISAEQARLPDPVTFAVRLESGDIPLAQAWLDAGLDPDFQGSRIGTGLMIGAWEGNLELMRLFLSRGADIDKANDAGESALVLAAWRGKGDAVKWLLERGARINAGEKRWSALHYAVFNGNKELAAFLMDQGADINARSSNGSTPLMMAIYEGHEDLARSLIEKGADRGVKNDWGDGALEWAMRFNRLKLARMVASPEEFNIAVAQPKEKWGPPQRSLRTSKELEDLLAMREVLVSRNLSTQTIDARIAAERVRIVRAEMDAGTIAPRAATLEITASRKTPQEQSARIVYDKDGKPQGYKVPPATFSGKPRMPPKGPAKNY